MNNVDRKKEDYSYLYYLFESKLRDEVDRFGEYIYLNDQIDINIIRTHKYKTIIYSDILILLDYLIKNKQNTFKNESIKNTLKNSLHLLENDEPNYNKISLILSKASKKITEK